MSVIEGIGDEVTIFATVLFILLGLLIAWLSSLQPAPSTSDQATTSSRTSEPSTSTTRDNGPPDAFETSADDVTRTDEGENTTNLNAEPAPPGDSSSQQTQEDGLRQRSSQQIRIKLKYLDDRERVVLAKPNEQIGQFKRAHFLEELADDFNIRLIFNGQELRQENETLQSYNVDDNSVIHCLVSAATHQQQQHGNNGADREQDHIDVDMSNLMFPLFGLILGLIWYCRITYRTFFNAMSTLALLGVTVLFMFAVIITFRNQRRPEVVPSHTADGLNQRTQ
ncbi:transmembrane and ubiquitin-like domain-containing protein 1 [Tubulanus polymorphus]|uniref:transmembrane and ubiquitin-like domain-containing protein 1 n=1 Tax=Tubulanus polymorphus TaxID=672921 RepID=UPI003DA6ABC3